MIFVHLRTYNQLKMKQLTFYRCTKIAVFLDSIPAKQIFKSLVLLFLIFRK